jgi:hypothetical protein
LITRRLIASLSFVAVALHAGHAFAQDAFPAPQPGQAAAASSGFSFERDACMQGFVSLREEAEKRGKLIKAASERHAPPDEACRLIGNFGQSQIKMIKYITANSTQCGILRETGDQLRAGYKNTEAMQKMGPAGPVGDFDDMGPFHP